MFAQTLVLQLLRFEAERAQDVNKLCGQTECDLRLIRCREAWRKREEKDIVKDLGELQPFSPVVQDFIRKRSRGSSQGCLSNECRYLRSWGAPLPLNVRVLEQLLHSAQDWVELWLGFREDPIKGRPDANKKPSTVVASMSMQRLEEIKSAFTASLLQAWTRRVLRRKNEAESSAGRVICRAMKPIIQKWMKVGVIRRKHAAKRIQNWYKRRMYVTMLRLRFASRTRAEGQAYRRIFTARNRTWQAARDDPGLVRDWTAAQTIQSAARGFNARCYTACKRRARRVISCKLIRPYLARKTARYRAFVRRMAKESAKQRKWRIMRKSYRSFQRRLLEGVVWNMQARTELCALEQSKLANVERFASQFAAFEQALWRGVGKAKLGKGWVQHSSNERGEEQYLNLQTGRVQTEHPHRQVVQLRLRTEGEKAQNALHQHLDHLNKLVFCISANERCFRERLFADIAELIRDQAIHL